MRKPHYIFSFIGLIALWFAFNQQQTPDIPLCTSSVTSLKSPLRTNKFDQKYDIIGTHTTDAYGTIYQIGVENKQTQPVTLVFLEVGCVISQRMIPYLNELYTEAKSKKMKFYGILSSPTSNWAEAQQFQQEFNISFPLLFDANGDLAQRIQPDVVPQAYVFDIHDQLQYYGRINDQYIEVGKFNKQIRVADLQNAIQAVSEGKTPAIQHQKAVGCIFQKWPTKDRAITYNKDIEPIIRANCLACHKPNEIGPFPLLNYQDVARRGQMIHYVTKKRYMPIWKAKKTMGNSVMNTDFLTIKLI